MDTTTCVIKGQILSLTNDTLGYATIQIKSFLNEYKIVSDFEGKFKFNHISPGIYELTVNYVGYRPLLKNNLQLSSGEVRELKIGMGYIGQDDLKQIKK